MKVRVKICGIRRWDDAEVAVRAGADALGFVFSEVSPRYIAPKSAAAIIRRLPPFVVAVGVFVDAPLRVVEDTARACRLDRVQLHGEESPEVCTGLAHLGVYKAFRIQDARSLERLPAYSTATWLLDSYVPDQAGGTGEKFNWKLAVAAKKWGRPIILAGGLTFENVGEAIRRVQPYAVDVSSGVESEPGQKDPVKIRRFLEAVTLAVLPEYRDRENAASA